MLTLDWLDHLLFVVLAVVFPVRAGVFAFRRLMCASEDDIPRVKLSVYRHAMVTQWALTLGLAALWLALGRPWLTLGLVPRWTWGLGGVLVGLGIAVLVMLRQGRVSPEDDAVLDRLRERMRHLERMLPATPRELRWFYALSATAGVCEEILYRGFMIWYLSAWLALVLPGQHLFLAAAALSSVVFGAGHAYQGWRGIALTALVGGFLAAVYWITRSLFAGILIHALLDAHSGHVTFLAQERARERARAAFAAEVERLEDGSAPEPGGGAPRDEGGAPPPRA